MKCKECNYQNTATAKFCTNCGNNFNKNNPTKRQIKSKKSRNKMPQNNKRDLRTNYKIFTSIFFSTKGLWISATIIVGLFITFSIIDVGLRNINRGNDRFIDQKSDNPFVEAKVFEIASKFVCGCGDCNELSLDICKCDYAVDERELIRDYLENNNSEDNIIRAVINKYGGYKLDNRDELLSQNQLDINTVSVNQQVTDTNIVGSLNETSIASFNDREAIYEKFECPCGQCGIKELAQCTCTHVKGAKEVKKYIDMQITKNKFSSDQIVQMVAEMYGGLK